MVKLFKNRCFYCDDYHNIHKLTVDHIIPKSKGGTNDITNLVPSCHQCNSKKADFDINYFMREILKLKECKISFKMEELKAYIDILSWKRW